MTNKTYDLEERCYLFAKNVRTSTRRIQYSAFIIDDIRQLIRASGSVGANYIEANESLGQNDFVMKIRTSRKEAKESRFWLKLLADTCPIHLKNDFIKLLDESDQLLRIFSSILVKYNRNKITQNKTTNNQ